MKSIKSLSKSVAKVLDDNAPAILAGIGCVGVVGTAYLTGRATFKAAETLNTAKMDLYLADPQTTKFDSKAVKIERKEAFKLVWLNYLPAAGVGALSIAAIVGSHHINAKRMGALAAAYAITEKRHEEYKDKVLELAGKNKTQKIDDETAQHLVSENYRSDQVHKTYKGDTLFMDEQTGRCFESNMEEVKGAQNHINNQVLMHDSASMNDFYDWLGLPHVPMGEELGWTSKNGKKGLMDLAFSTTMTDDGRPCIVVKTNKGLVRDPQSFR